MPVRARARRMRDSGSTRDQSFTTRRRYLTHPPLRGRIRSRGKNTKRTQFRASQLQTMSYGDFCVRRRPDGDGEKRASLNTRHLVCLSPCGLQSYYISPQSVADEPRVWPRQGAATITAHGFSRGKKWQCGKPRRGRHSPPHRLQQNRGSVGTSEQAPEESVGRCVGPPDRRDRRSLLPRLVTTQVGTSDPACPERNMSRRYMTNGAMRKKLGVLLQLK